MKRHHIISVILCLTLATVSILIAATSVDHTSAVLFGLSGGIWLTNCALVLMDIRFAQLLEEHGKTLRISLTLIRNGKDLSREVQKLVAAYAQAYEECKKFNEEMADPQQEQGH